MISPSSSIVYLLISFGIISTAPISNEENDLLGLAWEAAATSINVNNPGKFWVPIELVSSQKSGSGTTILEYVFQESWCSIAEGNDLDDVCESMCPVYYGGAKATYRITATQSNGGTDYQSQRIE